MAIQVRGQLLYYYYCYCYYFYHHSYYRGRKKYITEWTW